MLGVVVLMVSGALTALGQSLPSYPNVQQTPAPSITPDPTQSPDAAQDPDLPPSVSLPVKQGPSDGVALARLEAFKKSDVKFSVDELVDILQDKRHEGWVLTAYPDPHTAQPLIGAGFSLDLPERLHPQKDVMNPNQFIEPSSAELWQAAGLAPEKLKEILGVYYKRLDSWGKVGFREQMMSLDLQITETDAQALTRIGVIQAAINAKAYCRYFRELTASQQMGMTQLVYQMGVNMEEFTTFLGLINRQKTDDAGNITAVAPSAIYWRDVQMSLLDSRWAKAYKDRATAVVAMFDPRYAVSPISAERKVYAVLHPPRRRGHAGRGALREARLNKKHATGARKRAARRRRE